MFWKVFKNSIKLLMRTFLVMLQSFCTLRALKGKLGTQMALQGSSKVTRRTLGHSRAWGIQSLTVTDQTVTFQIVNLIKFEELTAILCIQNVFISLQRFYRMFLCWFNPLFVYFTCLTETWHIEHTWSTLWGMTSDVKVRKPIFLLDNGTLLLSFFGNDKWKINDKLLSFSE